MKRNISGKILLILLYLIGIAIVMPINLFAWTEGCLAPNMSIQSEILNNAFLSLSEIDTINFIIPPISITDLGGLGDANLVIATVHRLRKQFPGKKVEVILTDLEWKERIGELLENSRIEEEGFYFINIGNERSVSGYSAIFKEYNDYIEKNIQPGRKTLSLIYAPRSNSKEVRAMAASIFMNGPVSIVYDFGAYDDTLIDFSSLSFGFLKDGLGLPPVSAEGLFDDLISKNLELSPEEETSVKRSYIKGLNLGISERDIEDIISTKWSMIYPGSIEELEIVLKKMKSSSISPEKTTVFIFDAGGIVDFTLKRFANEDRGINLYAGSTAQSNTQSVFNGTDKLNVISFNRRVEKNAFNESLILFSQGIQYIRGPNLLSDVIYLSRSTGGAWIMEFQPHQEKAKKDFIRFVENCKSLDADEKILFLSFYLGQSDGLIDDILINGSEYKRIFRNFSEEIYNTYVDKFNDNIGNEIKKGSDFFNSRSFNLIPESI